MSKKEKPQDSCESISMYEKELYENVEEYFCKKINCEKSGSAINSSISLQMFGGTMYPDVYGITNPENQSFEIFMAEGKRDFAGRKFDICKGQGITLQRFADYVYLFFPKESWNQLEDIERSNIINECENLKLGLLLVDGKNCEEIVQPSKNKDLLDEEKRIEAKETIVQYFPSFSSDENTQFFDNFSGMAMNIAGESYLLLDECRKIFGKIMETAVYTYIYYDEEEKYFQFAFQKKRKGCMVYLLMNPFGRSLFQIKKPLLTLEKYFDFDFYKRNKKNLLLNYCEKCFRSKQKILVRYSSGEFVVENVTQLSKILEEKKKIMDIIIIQAIEIVGKEIKTIVRNVERNLGKVDAFLKTVQIKREKTRKLKMDENNA